MTDSKTESNLMKQTHEELYKLYDESKDDTFKELIKKVVNKKPLDDEESDFQAYPEYQNPLFSTIIYQKQEFYSNQLFLDTTGIEDTCNAEFSIKAHQSFLKNFMTKESPYRSLLVYHGVGVGKTCSGVTIAENFRDAYGRKDKRIIILSSKNIQIGWKKTIYTPKKGSNQCTGDTFTNSEATTDRDVNKLVKQYYEIMAYQSFSNFVKRMIASHIQKFPDEEKAIERINCIRDYFSNRLLIIDEVHNIRDEQGSPMRDTVKMIEEVIKYSDNLRLLLLTATPMYNRSTEILWIVNMMLLNDKRDIIHKKDVLGSDGEFTDHGLQLLEEKTRGYISYLRGENPITFPLRLYPSQLKKYLKYTKNITSPCIIKQNKPRKNIVGGKILSKDELKFLELFGTPLQNLQLEVYKQSIKTLKTLITENPSLDIDVRGEMNPILDNIKLTQITDMVYPSDKDNLLEKLKNDEIDLDEFYGERGLKNCMNKRGNKYSYKKKILDTYGQIFRKDKIGNYSSKLASIITSIDQTDGIVFIYTNYISSGILPLQFVLEQNGYKKHTGEPSLHIEGQKPTPISFDGLSKDKVSGPFKQAKYMVIDGSTSKKLLQHQLDIINSKENMYGEKIKVVIGTVVASEGLDFKRLRSVHIMDPWLHLNRIEQTVGRAIRFCSHADLPPEKRNVLIYLHVAVLGDQETVDGDQGEEYKDQETVDTCIYRYAEKKSMQIGIIETVLKKNAVDRYLFKDVNVITKNDIQSIKLQPPIKGTSAIVVKQGDKEYSKVCSYQEDCDYNKDIHTPDENQYDENKDTFIDIYSSTTITNLKKRISLLYKHSYVYDLSSIMGLLHEYGFQQNFMIYLSIDDMITNKSIIHDKFGNSGYLINKHSYYIFQPFMCEDETIPLYYRANLLEKMEDKIILPRLNEIEDKGVCNSHYSTEQINSVYDKMDELLDNYEEDTEEADVNTMIEKINKIYPDISSIHTIITEYLFDRLTFEDKCKLMYGHLMHIYNENERFKDIQLILERFVLYISSKNEIHFEYKKGLTDFGFVLSYNSKPCYFQFDNDTFKVYPCNQYNHRLIDMGLKKYTKSGEYKQLFKSSDYWGYTTMRPRKNKKECVLKLVEPNNKLGNVCIDNNLLTKVEKLIEIMKKKYSEITPIFDDTLVSKKKNICFLLEIIFRYDKNNSFFSYDKVWLKYR